MYLVLNYLIFVILCVLSLKYIFASQKLVKHPFDGKQKFPVTGMQYFFLFTLLTGILSLGNLSATRLLFTIIFCLLTIFYDRNKPVFSIVTVLYSIFLFWLLCAILYSPVKNYGFRVFLKYLSPFLMLILASKVTSSAVFSYKAIKYVFFVGICGTLYILVFSRIPVIDQLTGGVFWWFPAILDFLPVAICIALSYFSLLKKKKYIWFALLFILPSLVTTNRTGLLAASISVTIYSVVRYKIKSIPYVIIGLAIFFGTVLYVPAFRDKMFRKAMTTEEIMENKETLTTDDIDSNGRFAMWEWSLAHYYEGKELTGSGLGVLQEVFYSLNHPFGTIRIVHNDYVQLLCDTGLIGLILYLSVFISLFLHAIILAWRQNASFPVRFIAMIAGPAMLGVAVTLYTDNAVNYSLMTLNYPFAIYGMLLGLKRNTMC